MRGASCVRGLISSWPPKSTDRFDRSVHYPIAGREALVAEDGDVLLTGKPPVRRARFAVRGGVPGLPVHSRRCHAMTGDGAPARVSAELSGRGDTSMTRKRYSGPIEYRSTPRTEESKSAAARSPQVARVDERAAGHPRSPRRCFPFATFPLPARITTFPAADPGQCPTAAYRISDRESGGGLGIRRVPARRWTRLLLDSRSTSVAVRIRERRPRDTASIHDHQRERLCSFSTNEMRAVTGAERRGVVLIRLMCFLNALRP